MNYENYIESQYRSLNDKMNYEYLELYQSINNTKLKQIFSTLHAMIISTFKIMNERLPTKEYVAHFWADPSRDLISTIEIIEGLQRSLKNTQYAFDIDKYYKSVIDKCNTFLSRSGGSEIPPYMDKVELYYIVPIFISQNTITTAKPEINKSFKLKLIGEGSYAKVFKYRDEFYQKDFVLKRAKKDLSKKELDRFKREFEQMKNLSSPYIVEVFNYDDTTNEYTMEYMDFTLNDYIIKNNTKLTFTQRKALAFQILKAFSYIRSKKLLHRDISPKNVLVKKYDDVLVVKIADFGLVRIPESTLTTMNTEFKGYFNDPSLMLEGFENYTIIHETYALTRLLYFVMEGRTNTDKIGNQELKNFVIKGLNPDKSMRYQDIDEMLNEFKSV